MRRVRDQYSEEFINKLTDDFLLGPMAIGKEARIRSEILKVREKNYSALFLEMYFAVKTVLLEDAIVALKISNNAMEFDELIIGAFEAETRLTDNIISFYEERPSQIAKSGGKGRAAKFDDARAETIRLYEQGKAAGKWQTGRHHVPDAALEITPQIVAFSKGKSNLLPTTDMPKKWIRAYLKHGKNSAC